MAVIGVGATSRVTVDDVLGVVARASTRAEQALARGKIAMQPNMLRDEEKLIHTLATLDRAAINPILRDAAHVCGLDLVLLSLDELRATASLCVTFSEKSMKQYAIPSVAEAAALAAAGLGARLLIPRFCGRNTTFSVAFVP
jgi:cobalt-precorrin 5A hydrolase